MSALTALETKLRNAWQDLTTDVRAELEQAVTDAKAEAAQFAPLLQTFKADLTTAISAAEPGLKTSVEGLAEKLLADAAKIIGTDLGV